MLVRVARVLPILCSLLVTKNIVGPYGHVIDKPISSTSEYNEQKLEDPDYEYEDSSRYEHTTLQDYMLDDTNKLSDETRYKKEKYLIELKQRSHGIKIKKNGKVDYVAQEYEYAENMGQEYNDEKSFVNDDNNNDDEYRDEEEYYHYNDGEEEEEDTTANSDMLQPGDPDYELGDYSLADPTEYDTPECEGSLTLHSKSNYRGRHIILEEGVPDLSIQFPSFFQSGIITGDCCWTLFTRRYYLGTWVTLHPGQGNIRRRGSSPGRVGSAYRHSCYLH